MVPSCSRLSGSRSLNQSSLACSSWPPHVLSRRLSTQQANNKPVLNEGTDGSASCTRPATLFARLRTIIHGPGDAGKERLRPAGRAVPLPAQVVGAAHATEVQAVGLLLVLVGAAGQDGLPAALGACLVLAGAEEHAVGVLAGHAVEELAQRLVAPAAVAGLGGRDLAVADGDVGGAQLLAVVVQVAGLGGVQAVVAPGADGRVCPCPWSRERERGQSPRGTGRTPPALAQCTLRWRPPLRTTQQAQLLRLYEGPEGMWGSAW